jgi:lipopolysaccharide/colanic/teichoic acid biosynthesis glycosyltransferase
MNKMYFFFKRIFDILFSIFLIICFSPILLIVMLLIKITSKGPMFFIQQRVGKDGEPFGIMKFRTMIVGAEKMGTGLDSFEDDPRVTKIGKFLRDSSLDELPQLFNILKGDMSFIGPRPPVTYSPFRYEDYPQAPKKRFTIKPGVSGWAQINGRNELTWEEKWKYDLEYLEKMSFWFDIKIILLTILKVLKNEGSYDAKK